MHDSWFPREIFQSCRHCYRPREHKFRARSLTPVCLRSLPVVFKDACPHRSPPQPSSLIVRPLLWSSFSRVSRCLLSFCTAGDRHPVCRVQLLGPDRLQDDGEALQRSGARGLVGVPGRVQSYRHRGNWGVPPRLLMITSATTPYLAPRLAPPSLEFFSVPSVRSCKSMATVPATLRRRVRYG